MNGQRNYVQNLANGFMSTLVIYTGCELGLFEALKEGQESISRLEEALEISREALLRVARPLEQYQLLRIHPDSLELLEPGRLLCRNHPESLLPYVLFCGRESLTAWSCMYPALKQKTTPGKLLSQSGIFQEMEGDETRFQTFNGMMQSVSRQLNLTPFLDAFLEKKKEPLRIVDVGGGTGTILKKFLQYDRNARGLILDLAQAEEAARKNLKESHLEDRADFLEGNFFEPIREEADVFILSRVLHDWEDPQALAILENVAAAMDEESCLVVFEEMIRKPGEPGAMRSYMNDIQMWVFCDGRERTVEEFSALFEQAGLRLEQTFDLEAGTTALVVKKEWEETGEL